jgi:hypothetical protein
MSNFTFIFALILGLSYSTQTFATEAESAADSKCSCKKTKSIVACQIAPFPGHLEGVALRSDHCTLKEGSENTYDCLDDTFNFTDGSKLSSVPCQLSAEGTTASSEIEENPVLAKLKKMAQSLFDSGEKTGEKVQGSEWVEQAQAAAELENKQTALIQSGVDAYEKEKNSAPARDPASAQ